MRKPLRGLILSLLLCAVLPVPRVAAAETTESAATGGPSGGSKFFISLGGYLTTLQSDAGAEAAGSDHTVDVEEVLGVDSDRNVARLEGYWRFKPRHRLDFTYYYVNRDGSRKLDEGFEYDGVRYEANATIDSEFKQQYLKLAYRFAFVNNDRLEVGCSAGLATFKVDADLSGQGKVLVDGVPTGATDIRRSENSVIAPVPNVGLYGEFRLAKPLVLRESFDWFALEASGNKGAFSELRITLDYRFVEHWGVGAGWTRTALKYNEDGDNAVEYNADISGIIWYFTYSF